MTRPPTRGGRRGRASRRWLLLLALAALVGTVGCQATTPRTAHARGPAVVVASFAFPESDLLAEIYAQALMGAGVPVRRELDLGPRELVRPALEQGLVDVVPEYLGTALAGSPATVPADAADVPAARRALDRALAPWRLRTLEPAAASDQNGLVVTRATARRLDLTTVSDLRAVAHRLTFVTTPECPRRAYCLPGLRQVYGVRFGHLLPLATETERVAALREGVADVALVFTTDGAIAGNGLVLLRDDRALQPAENVVPVVSSRVVARYGARLVTTLNRVSAQLSQANLVFLNWRVGVAGNAVRSEARGWLLRHRLLPREQGG